MRPLIYNEHCCKCSRGITFSENDYSINHFQLPLCIKCQHWYRGLENEPTLYAKKLFLSLREKGFRVMLEYNDGSKTIDICSEDSMIHIEVDGEHHSTKTKQAISDLWRTYFSLKKGYYTLHVPNLAIKEEFEQTARAISNILIERKRQRQSKNEASSYSFQDRLINAFVRQLKI